MNVCEFALYGLVDDNGKSRVCCKLAGFCTGVKQIMAINNTMLTPNIIEIIFCFCIFHSSWQNIKACMI